MYTFVLNAASESWTLARMLPLLVGDLVPDDDPHWLNFLLLLSIIDIIMAPKTTRALAAYLRELILQHHTAFKELYPERPITPKMHYIIHIPQWMIRWGDLHTMNQSPPSLHTEYLWCVKALPKAVPYIMCYFSLCYLTTICTQMWSTLSYVVYEVWS